MSVDPRKLPFLRAKSVRPEKEGLPAPQPPAKRPVSQFGKQSGFRGKPREEEEEEEEGEEEEEEGAGFMRVLHNQDEDEDGGEQEWTTPEEYAALEKVLKDKEIESNTQEGREEDPFTIILTLPRFKNHNTKEYSIVIPEEMVRRGVKSLETVEKNFRSPCGPIATLAFIEFMEADFKDPSSLDYDHLFAKVGSWSLKSLPEHARKLLEEDLSTEMDQFASAYGHRYLDLSDAYHAMNIMRGPDVSMDQLKVREEPWYVKHIFGVV